MSSTSIRSPQRSDAWFVTTHWSVVVSAGLSDTPRAAEALQRLCQSYWYPLYGYVRRRGYSPHDAQDLTQGFFAHLLEHETMTKVDRAKGKFRSFLLASINHYLSDVWDKSRAQKRNAGQLISLDLESAETLYLQQPDDALTPEKTFERRWALTLLEQVYDRLRQDYQRDGKGDLFEALRFSLMGERSAVPYVELARRLNMNEGAVKVAVHRLRQNYRSRLRNQIAETVTTPQEVDKELRCLLRALAD
jgi:RNA polymerase sigma factor (sigma-70 family)